MYVHKIINKFIHIDGQKKKKKPKQSQKLRSHTFSETMKRLTTNFIDLKEKSAKGETREKERRRKKAALSDSSTCLQKRKRWLWNVGGEGFWRETPTPQYPVIKKKNCVTGWINPSRRVESELSNSSLPTRSQHISFYVQLFPRKCQQVRTELGEGDQHIRTWPSSRLVSKYQ